MAASVPPNGRRPSFCPEAGSVPSRVRRRSCPPQPLTCTFYALILVGDGRTGFSLATVGWMIQPLPPSHSDPVKPRIGTFVARPQGLQNPQIGANFESPGRGSQFETLRVANADSGAAPVPGDGSSAFGCLGGFVVDSAVTDILVTGSGEVWLDRGSGVVRAPTPALSKDEARELAVHLIAAGGRHIDEANPCVDARLAGGIRVHAVLPPVSPGGALLSVRISRARSLTLEQLAASGMVHDVNQLRRIVIDRENILITGAGGSGKTTLLAALLSTAPETERIVAIEDVAELAVRHPHFVVLEARQSNLEGAGEISVSRLVREALRMRPDRLVLGECRGAEISDLLSALNTGHDGGGGTLHANSLHDVPARIEALGALAGLSAPAIARQAVSAIGVVLHLERRGGERRLAQTGALALDRRDRLVVA